MAIREGVVNGGWMAGSQFDRDFWVEQNEQLKRQKEMEFQNMLTDQKAGTGMFASDYNTKYPGMFNKFVNNRIAGEQSGKLNIAGDNRFSQFLTNSGAPPSTTIPVSFNNPNMTPTATPNPTTTPTATPNSNMTPMASNTPKLQTNLLAKRRLGLGKIL